MSAPAVRLRSIAAVAGTATALVLSACGGGGADASRDNPVAGETSPFTFDDYSTEIPVDPERVVVLDSRTGLEFALMMEWSVIASDWTDVDGPLVPQLDETVGQIHTPRMELDVEEVAAYDPDMLVTSESWWHWYREQGIPIDDIAPVYVVDEPEDPQRWKESFTEQMRALDRSETATELLERYESTVAEVRAGIPEQFDGARIALGGGLDEFWLNGNRLSVAVARDLGFDVVIGDADEFDDTATWSYSAENLEAFSSADALFMQNLDHADVFGAATWQHLPAVQAGHVADLPGTYSAGLVLTAEDLARHLGDSLAQMD